MVDFDNLGASKQSLPATEYPQVTPASPQQTFINTITRSTTHSQLLSDACDWYIAFLEFKIREAWNTLFQPVLNSESITNTPSDSEIGLAFQILTSVVEELHTENLALVGIVDELYNREFLNELESDEDRSIGSQLAFSIVGWISKSSRAKRMTKV